MINIEISADQQQEISCEYYHRLIKWIDKKRCWTGLGNTSANEMMQYMYNHSREYFLAPALKLYERSSDFSNQYLDEKNAYLAASKSHKPSTSYGIFLKRMRDIYKGFMQDKYEKDEINGYWLMKRLNVRVCPYCNRNYTITIKTKELKVRPEFDHFFPESLHPSLILSFYNFIPSCPQCNHLKRVQELEVNPWIGYKTKNRPTFHIDVSNGDFPEKPVVLIENENDNTKKLGVKELYNEHTDYVRDILNKILAYNPVTYYAILKDFQGIVHTEADLERMVWGNYSNLAEARNRPFAKLTADILEQYKKYL